MKLKLTFFVCSFWLFLACSPKKESTNYTINLSVKGLEDSTLVSLTKIIDSKIITIDSIYFSKNNKELKGSQDANIPVVGRISIDGKRGSAEVVLEKGNIKIVAQADTLYRAVVTGTALNDKQTAYNKEIDKIWANSDDLYDQWQEANKTGDTAQVAKIEKKYDSLEAENNKQDALFIKQNSNNILGPKLANRKYYSDEHLEEMDSVVSQFDALLDSSVYVKQLHKNINTWRKVQIGMQAPNFSQADTSGVQISLESFRGQYLLVDFWASWCGPCRAENPNVVAAYNKYHNLGFNILGVSYDTNKNKWMNAIAKDGLTWTQVSDLQGWQNATSEIYGIRAIPHSILLDPQGVIIAKNLRGEKLQEKLEELLGN